MFHSTFYVFIFKGNSKVKGELNVQANLQSKRTFSLKEMHVFCHNQAALIFDQNIRQRLTFLM